MQNPVTLTNNAAEVTSTNPLPVAQQVSGSAVTSANPLSTQIINGGAVVSSTNPFPVSAPTAELVFSPSITSGGVYSSGMCIGLPQTITSGGSLRHLSVDWNTSQTQTISALVFRAATVSSTLTDKTAASVGAADVGKVVGGAVLSATLIPGGSGTVWSATGIDIVVSSGAQVAIIAGGTMNSAGAATSGLTVGAGIV